MPQKHYNFGFATMVYIHIASFFQFHSLPQSASIGMGTIIIFSSHILQVCLVSRVSQQQLNSMEMCTVLLKRVGFLR